MGGIKLAQKSTKKYRIIRAKGTTPAKKRPVIVTKDNIAQASNKRFSPYTTLDAPIAKRRRTSNPTAKKGKENRLSKAIKSILDPNSGTDKPSKFTENGEKTSYAVSPRKAYAQSSTERSSGPVLNKESGSHNTATPPAPNEGRTSLHDKISPEKVFRVAMLKHRFADTLFKATHHTLYDRKESEAAKALQKIQLQREREAARMKLENMQETINICDNLETMRDFEKMVCCGTSVSDRDTYFGRWH